jgi:hypothetical protein
MEIEAKSENKRLNALVATTVVIISVYLAISKLIDDDIVRSMEFIKSDSVDVWNEYQAERIKLHGDENALHLLDIVHADNAQALAGEQQRLGDQLAKYKTEAPKLAAKARAADSQYESLKSRHEQFDVEDGILSISLALMAVAALTEIYWLLATSWGFALFGFVMGLAGIFDWGLHPEALVKFLG